MDGASRSRDGRTRRCRRRSPGDAGRMRRKARQSCGSHVRPQAARTVGLRDSGSGGGGCRPPRSGRASDRPAWPDDRWRSCARPGPRNRPRRGAVPGPDEGSLPPAPTAGRLRRYPATARGRSCPRQADWQRLAGRAPLARPPSRYPSAVSRSGPRGRCRRGTSSAAGPGGGTATKARQTRTEAHRGRSGQAAGQDGRALRSVGFRRSPGSVAARLFRAVARADRRAGARGGSPRAPRPRAKTRGRRRLPTGPRRAAPHGRAGGGRPLPAPPRARGRAGRQTPPRSGCRYRPGTAHRWRRSGSADGGAGRHPRPSEPPRPSGSPKPPQRHPGTQRGPRAGSPQAPPRRRRRAAAQPAFSARALAIRPPSPSVFAKTVMAWRPPGSAAPSRSSGRAPRSRSTMR